MARTGRPPKSFWSYVNKTPDCWLWTGTKSGEGYGRLRRDGRFLQAHRIAYELVVGPIPPGLTLDHLCRERACVNPAHLEPVTDRVNIMRGVGLAAQNAAKTHCIRGHLLPAPNRFGRRDCLPCRRMRDRVYGRVRYWLDKRATA